MELTRAEQLAKKLMNEHGLNDWKFKFNNSYLSLGVTTTSKVSKVKEIALSKIATSKCSEEIMRDVILHEIAHALVHEQGLEDDDQDHGPTWQSMAAYVGAGPEACQSLAKHLIPEEGKKIIIAAGALNLEPKQVQHWDSCDCKHCEHNIKTLLNVYEEVPEHIKFLMEQQMEVD